MHNCRAAVVHCIDFRLGRKIKEFMEEQGLLGDADIISFAGAAKNFVDEATREFALHQVELSRNLHQVKEIHLINHTDCGAYGGSEAFAAPHSERNLLSSDLRTAAEIIRGRWSDLAIKLWIARLDHGGTVWLEAIE